jgi:hypothetical protein
VSTATEGVADAVKIPTAGVSPLMRSVALRPVWLSPWLAVVVGVGGMVKPSFTKQSREES